MREHHYWVAEIQDTSAALGIRKTLGSVGSEASIISGTFLKKKNTNIKYTSYKNKYICPLRSQTHTHTHTYIYMGFPGVVKNLLASARDIRDAGSTPGSGRSPRESNGNLLQCSFLENPMDRGA